MTEEEIEQVVQATTPRASVWTRLSRKFATWFKTTWFGELMNRHVKVWNLTAAVLVVAGLGFPLVINSIGATNRHVHDVEQQNTEQALYTQSLVAYVNASNTYAVCLASANAFAADRTRWSTLADSFEAEFGAAPGTQAVVDLIRAALGPADPLTISDCPPPGDPPQPPKGTT